MILNPYQDAYEQVESDPTPSWSSLEYYPPGINDRTKENKMATTLEELKTHLKDIEETLFLEMFNISIDELVERFEDKIEAEYDRLIKEFGNE